MTRRRIVAGVVASLMVIAASWIDGANRAEQSSPEVCAARLNLAYTVAAGAVCWEDQSCWWDKHACITDAQCEKGGE